MGYTLEYLCIHIGFVLQMYAMHSSLVCRGSFIGIYNLPYLKGSVLCISNFIQVDGPYLNQHHCCHMA